MEQQNYLVIGLGFKTLLKTWHLGKELMKEWILDKSWKHSWNKWWCKPYKTDNTRKKLLKRPFFSYQI